VLTVVAQNLAIGVRVVDDLQPRAAAGPVVGRDDVVDTQRESRINDFRDRLLTTPCHGVG
jgi:hypothetical protein